MIIWGLLQPVLFQIYFALVGFSSSQQNVIDVTRYPNIYFLVLTISAAVAMLSLFIHIQSQYKHLWVVIVGKASFDPVCWVKFGFFGVFLAVTTSSILNFTGIDPGFSSDLVFSQQAMSVMTVMNIVIATIVVVPLFEELLFRGYLPSLAHHFGLAKGWCVFISSALWTIIHGQYNWQALCLLFSLGLLFGMVRFHYKSLWASFVIHCSFNLTTLGIFLLQTYFNR